MYFEIGKICNHNKPSKKMINRQHFKKTIRIRIHKPIIKTFKRHKVYSSFKYKIWGDDLADMQLIDK